MNNDLVGTEIEVLDDQCNVVKTITIKSQREIDKKVYVTDEEGNIYSEDELNLTYQITPEAMLWLQLKEAGFIHEDLEDEFDFDTYHQLFESFMNGLVKLDILKKAE